MARAAGITRWLTLLFVGRGYEVAFEAAVLAATLEGDCVWDIGANVGFYTVRFAKEVGRKGSVFAFEPSPFNRAHLERAIENSNNITIVPFALGDRDAIMKFKQGSDSNGATSRLVSGTENSVKGTIEVKVARGDKLVEDGIVPLPNVVKIDTEGSELEVLRGLSTLLVAPALRSLCIEIHFERLRERGFNQGPREIERLLGASGFQCRWTDPSHLIAERRVS